MILGNLSVAEIQNILKNQKEDNDTDWIAEIQELKVHFIYFCLSSSLAPFRNSSNDTIEKHGC